MSELYNDYGMVEIVGIGDLTERFVRVRFMDTHVEYLNQLEEGYLLFADTMRYRMDGEPHPLDVSADNETGRRAHEADASAYLRSLE
ncbi:hypothetical protein [Rhizobium leguminosarum]|uniref:Uncharacterized protein n=1 Tax=Rhizobium leguminosarum TaxID=384 RepID=A0A7M3DQH7_RHILE|nr:hypothetical protein [Rhizobium leguminosarum]TAY50946.1 hypothetical protein ELH90_04100 [Rhizobium leguminosarum]